MIKTPVLREPKMKKGRYCYCHHSKKNHYRCECPECGMEHCEYGCECETRWKREPSGSQEGEVNELS